MRASPLHSPRFTATSGTLCCALVAALIGTGWLAMLDMLRADILSFDAGMTGPGMSLVAALVLHLEGIPSGLWESLCRTAVAGSFSWGGWGNACAMGTIMMLSMMLPCATPVWRSWSAGERPWRALGFMGGYALSWTLFSVILASTDMAVHMVAGDHLVSADGATGAFAASVLIVAGAYQFTGAKSLAHRRLHCHDRMPVGKDMSGTRASLTTGMRYGRCCVRSNGLLMATMAVLGMMNLVAMALLTAIMLIEKKTTHRRVTDVIGLGFIIAGLCFAVSALSV